MAGPSGGGCKPGCTCRRHNPKHREDCLCNRCGGAARRVRLPKHAAAVEAQHRADVIPIDRRKSGHPHRNDVCLCGHVEDNHDPFGCKTCESRITNGFPSSRPCLHYRPRYGYANKAEDMTYEQEVKSEGFIKHIGELATCTGCWTVVKLGEANTLTSVISARAHVQICTAHVRARQESRRPGKGYGVG
jgi:hypothetical protein